KLVGIGELLAVQIVEQQLLGFVLVHVLARIDEAVSGAMLEGDPPLPAGLSSGRPRVRRERGDAAARHRNRAIARQPPAPVLVAGVKSLLDQKPAEPRTVDEEIGSEDAPVLKRNGSDIPAFVLGDIDNLAFGAPNTVLLGE